MIIRGYAGIPMSYAPDVGEVVLARRTPVDPFVRAVVVRVRRNRARNLKITVIWLEDDPNAGTDWSGRGKRPIKAHQFGWIEVRQGRGVPPLIKQISRGAPPVTSGSEPPR